MQHCRLYFLDDGNHIVSVLDLHCENEEQARERAWQLVDNQVVELWQEERFIGRFGVPSKPH